MAGHSHPTVNGEDVVITVADRRPAVGFKVVDAVGEVFEVLNARWVGAHKSSL